jgi:hypothetical protein
VVKVVSTWGNQKAKSGGMGRVFRIFVVVAEYRTQLPRIYSGHQRRESEVGTFFPLTLE